MRKHFKYLSYVLRHKWFVFIECCRLGIWWRGIIHDWSKFLPCEWFPYAEHFYGEKKGTQRDKTGYYKPTDTGDPAFDLAWLHHANWNPHHWQWWVQADMENEHGNLRVHDMPEWAILEMVADWRGASRAQRASGTVKEWYLANAVKMAFTLSTQDRVEDLLGIELDE